MGDKTTHDNSGYRNPVPATQAAPPPPAILPDVLAENAAREAEVAGDSGTVLADASDVGGAATGTADASADGNGDSQLEGDALKKAGAAANYPKLDDVAWAQLDDDGKREALRRASQ